MQLKYLNFHVTNKCNLNCRHCLYLAGQKELSELTLDNIQRILSNFAEITQNNGILNLFGGESLLREDIFEIISFAKNKGLQVGMTTNANFEEEVISKLNQAGLSRITIDLDGGSKETHDWLRNSEGHFDKSLANIKHFIQKGICTNVTSVLHKNNVHEISLILQKCKELKVSSLAFYLFTALGRGKKIKELMLSGKEWLLAKQTIMNWIEVNKPYFDIIWEKSYDTIESSNEKYFSLCDGEPKESIDVRCDGNVYFCGLLPSVDGSPAIGNLKTEDLSEVLKRTETYAFKNKSGCAALALNEKEFDKNVYTNIYNEKLIDPRKIEDGIMPVCPYDWCFLNKMK